MTITIRPTPMEDGEACRPWREAVATLVAIPPGDWTGDQYRAFTALIVQAFTDLGLTHIVGVCDRGEPSDVLEFWKVLSEGKAVGTPRHDHPQLIQVSGWWHDDKHGQQLLRWEWIRWPKGKEPKA